MPHPSRSLTAMVACLAATACAIPAQRIDDREDLIAAAGFGVRPANTQKANTQGWQASPHNLLPSHFVQQARGGGMR